MASVIRSFIGRANLVSFCAFTFKISKKGTRDFLNLRDPSRFYKVCVFGIGVN